MTARSKNTASACELCDAGAGHGPHHEHEHGHDHVHAHALIRDPSDMSLAIWSPSGVVAKAPVLRKAAKRLGQMGFQVSVDESAARKHQRFAGTDAERLDALHRMCDVSPDIVLATRGGYGVTRLLPQIDWSRLASSVSRGTRWVGHSDLTALQLGLLATEGAVTWHGPMACGDFGADEVDDITAPCFVEAMTGELEAVGFRTEAGFDGLEGEGVLWGGNLSMICSLLGTPWFPHIEGGVLFVEDVNEHPYRVERCLLQLAQAGVLDRQAAVLLGEFSDWRKSPLDKGYGLKSMVQAVRAATRTPVLTGLPFGHVPTKLTLPVGEKVRWGVMGRDVMLAWSDH